MPSTNPVYTGLQAPPHTQDVSNQSQPPVQTCWGKYKVTIISVATGAAVGLGIAAIVVFPLAAPIGLVALSIIGKAGIFAAGGLIGGGAGLAISKYCVKHHPVGIQSAEQMGKESFIRMVSPIMNAHTKKPQRSSEEVTQLCLSVSTIDPTLLKRLGRLSHAQREDIVENFSYQIQRGIINDHSTPYAICNTVNNLISQSVSPHQN